MYKKLINAYKTHEAKLELDERSERIIKKAKQYNVVLFANPNLAKKLLETKPKNTNTSKKIVEVFTWLLECESNTQMSKEGLKRKA